MKAIVYNGCDLLDSCSAKKILANKKLGLLTNMSGLTKDLKLASVELSHKYNLCALFGPEHGIYGTNQAGGFDKEQFIDPDTGAPVFDLFGGDGKIPASTESAFSSIEALVVNIQDIGVRYYTYQFAMLDCMKLCAKYNVEVIVLDRINPLGGKNVFGNRIEKDCLSYVGNVESQPAVYGMTIGELALWFNSHLNIGASVSVLRCEGWKRDMWFDDTDLLFVPPSPNMSSLETAILYPGTCFFEGTNLSEGRGTTKPFEMFGAPWLEPQKLIDFLDTLPSAAKEAMNGLVFRKCSYTPMFSKHKGEVCHGLQLHIRDRNSIDMYAVGLYLVYAVRNLYPDKFEFTRTMPLLTGTKKSIDEEFDPFEYVSGQKSKLEEFMTERNPFLLYD